VHGDVFCACNNTLGFAEWTDGHVVEVNVYSLKVKGEGYASGGTILSSSSMRDSAYSSVCSYWLR
jgi:hypothetical protein